MNYLLTALILTGFLLITLNLRMWRKFRELEKKLNNLKLISEQFPEFIAKSAQVSTDIYVQLQEKLFALRKVVLEGQELLSRLQLAERDLKPVKSDPEKIEKILLLVNQGFRAEEIAANLNIPLAEVEFILNLKRFMQNKSAEQL